VIVTFHAPPSWTVERPDGGAWWHAVTEGSEETLCTIEVATWQSRIRDDDQSISCPWCRARLVAVEIAAPPGELQGQSTRVRLHDEITAILRERNGWMTTQEIADAVTNRARYKKRDGSTVITALNVHGRTRNYPGLFERAGSRVRLRS